MQRRAAAAYSAFFLVIAIAAYLVAGTQYAQANMARNSLWGMVILCGFTIVLLVGMAYLPVRG